MPLTVVALFKANPDQVEALRDLLLTLPGPTRQEEGCLNYDLHQSTNDPAAFLFHENWRSQADLDRHLQSPHVTHLRSKVGPLVAEPPQITLWGRIN